MVFLALISTVLISTALVQSEPARDLSAADITARVRQGLQHTARIQQHFTYLERRRDVKISRLGKVTVGPVRTFEVYPSERPGEAYKRLIAVNDKPLTAAELAERDAEHRSDLEKMENETPERRARRLEKTAEEQEHLEAMISDAFAVFAPTPAGREWVDGQRVLVADLQPRADAHVTTREGGWMKRFAGRVWISETNYQIARIDMRAIDDVTIGWGIVGRIHKGSRFLLVRRFVEDVWLPSSLTYEASGRTLLFRPFHFSLTTTYSDHKRR
jgi:hypothetical protein